MITKYYKWYSYSLNRDMEYVVYGNTGVPFIYFPTQYNRFYEAFDKGVVATLSYLIESGKICLIAVDNIDYESLSNFASWDKRKRLEKQEDYYNYIINEFYPSIMNEYQFNSLPYTLGMSFGAFQAFNMVIRQPKLFAGVFAMSGIYKITYFINDYYDELAFYNSPLDQINLLKDENYIEYLRHKKILIVVSSGAYEEESLKETRELEEALNNKKIPHNVYYWTNNYPHDFPSWNIYLDYYIKDFI